MFFMYWICSCWLLFIISFASVCIHIADMVCSCLFQWSFIFHDVICRHGVLLRICTFEWTKCSIIQDHFGLLILSFHEMEYSSISGRLSAQGYHSCKHWNIGVLSILHMWEWFAMLNRVYMLRCSCIFFFHLYLVDINTSEFWKEVVRYLNCQLCH